MDVRKIFAEGFIEQVQETDVEKDICESCTRREQKPRYETLIIVNFREEIKDEYEKILLAAKVSHWIPGSPIKNKYEIHSIWFL